MTQGSEVCIIDYGMGNLSSVISALATLECRAESTSNPDDIAQARALILPGVGAFGEAMQRMRALNVIDALSRRVLNDKAPFLGICLGMQLIGQNSTEGGLHDGLGWIEAKIDALPADAAIRVPHIGWNEVNWSEDGPINQNVSDGSHFYFNHSYCMTSANGCVAAIADVGKPIVAAIRKDNIWGVQFHPEKSQNNGRRLLRNFLNSAQARKG